MIIKNDVDGVLVHQNPVFKDERGWFQELEKTAWGCPDFKQTNSSWSQFGVLRGLHLQKNNPQGKLVHCLKGTIYDVWIDLRPHSPTFKSWGAMQIQAEIGESVYLPPGLAHGFFVMSKFALVVYQCTTHYDKESDGGVYWRDPEINIEWPFSPGLTPILSDKDRKLPPVSEYLKGLESETQG